MIDSNLVESTHADSIRVAEPSEAVSLQGVVLCVCYRELTLESFRKFDISNLTSEVEKVVHESGVVNGIVNISVLHTTAAIVVTEWQDALNNDVAKWLDHVIDGTMDWEHNNPLKSDCDRRNATSHLKGLLLGSSVLLAVRERKVVRGQWQSIVFVELDGPRTRQVLVNVFGA